MPAATVIALLGAESTGKSSLALALARELALAGVDAAVVPEALRGFCDTHGRTPRVDEQPALALAQTAHIAAAAQSHSVVLADTTALMTAVYSDIYFGDASLYPAALDAHRTAHLTLLTTLDLPWSPDGIQRDGPAMRAAVDARLRSILRDHGVAFSVVPGEGSQRVQAALRTVWRCLHPPREPAGTPRWRWVCAHCGDGGCEAAAFALAR